MSSNFGGHMALVVVGVGILILGGLIYTNVQTSELTNDCEFGEVGIPPLSEWVGSIPCEKATQWKNIGLGMSGLGVLMVLAGFMFQLRDQQGTSETDQSTGHTEAE